MWPKKIALINATLFFLVWLVILYAGADHPPPPGFVLLILFDLLAALLVYLRVPTYINWSNDRTKHRFFYVILDGLAAGFGFALLAIFLPASGEPGVNPSVADYLIWFTILGAIGVANAVVIYSVNAFAVSRFRNSDQLL